MRLRWFCSHDYYAYGANRGENLLGWVTYSVDFQCRKCLRIKREIGYESMASAERAVQSYRRAMDSGLSRAVSDSESKTKRG